MNIDAFCEYPFGRVRVTAEGWVSFCCFMRPNPKDAHQDVYIGNVLEKTFDEIWFGEAAEAVRVSTAEGKLHKRCQRPGCPFSSAATPFPSKHIIYNEYPTFLEIDLPNTHCNVGGLRPDPITSPACIMCERSAPNFQPEEDHLFEVLGRLKHVMSNLGQIHIQGIAEPFYESREFGYLVFDVMDALEYDNFANQIMMSVTTNATLFKKSIREKWLNSAPKSHTTFSVDAATPETFKKIRIFDCFDLVVQNITDFCKERDPRRQYTKIHNNLNVLNVHEAVRMVQLAHNAGVDSVEFNPTDGFNRAIMVNEENCGLFHKAQDDIVEECNRLGMAYSFLRPLDLGMTSRLVQITL
jgi:hypothetical protein